MNRTLGTVLLAMALMGAAPAHAKKDKKKDKGIQETGIEAFDKVFSDVGSIDARLSNASKVLSSAKKELNTTLGLKKGTPLSDAIKELNTRADGKIGLAMNGKVPKLEPTDAVPTDVQTGIDSVNQMNTDIVTAIADLTQASKDVSSLVKQTKTFPKEIKNEFEGEGLLDKIFKMPKAAKATGHNLGITKELPKKTESVLGRMQDIEQTVRSEFVPLDSGNGPGRGADTVGPGRGGPGNGNGDGTARKPGRGAAPGTARPGRGAGKDPHPNKDTPSDRGGMARPNPKSP